MAKAIKKAFKNKFKFDIRLIAIKGINNIKTELAKSGQEANVSYTIKDKKISFIVEPKQEKAETEDVSIAQKKSVLKGFEKIPIGLLNQEIINQEFSTVGIKRAMKRTQEQAAKQIQDAVSKLI